MAVEQGIPRTKKEQSGADEQWKELGPLLSQYKPSPRGGRKPGDNREVFRGIAWVLRSEARWKDLPEAYPSPTAWSLESTANGLSQWLETVGMNERYSLRICFVAHSAYGAMRGGANGQIGGIERQQALAAKWFANHGHRVTMLTWDEGGPPEEMIDGVRILKICRQNAGLPGLRFFHPKWTRLDRALARADAEVYYQNCGEVITGQVALWCKRYGRRFVYSVASDPDCDPRLPEMGLRERVLYRHGLRKADRIIVQTRRQKDMLKQGFDLDAEVIPMPCVGPDEGVDSASCASKPQSAGVLWVGRVCRVKRPDRLVEVARACPDVPFDMVGPIHEDALGRKMRRWAEAIPNIHFHGPVELAQVAEYYRRASLLLCTSDYEGFPNTFLEAWSHGLPIVSTFDPDDLIVDRNMGIVAGDVDGLAAGVRELLCDRQRWQQASRAARRYYLDNHRVDAVMPKFERVFRDVANTIQNPEN